MSGSRRLPYLLFTAFAVFLAGCAEQDPPQATPAPQEPLPAVAPAPEMTSLEALHAIQARRAIIDVHEHIMSMNEVPLMLSVMDKAGVGRTALMGSSWFTITLNESVGFTRYDENNESLLEIAAAYPDRFEAWPTIDPEDPVKLDKLRHMVSRGAAGVKLYIGHGYVRRDNGEYMFHTRAMDDPEMLAVYRYCQENFIPICLHVNPHHDKPGFAQEFIALLTQFPDLKVVAPHFVLSSSWHSRFQEYMDTFPNLYTDCSFGDSFVETRLRWISKYPHIMRRMFEKYPTRIMFACDLVVTNHPGKTEEWALTQYQAYLDMLTKPTYKTPIIAKRDENNRLVPGELEELQGIELPPHILENVLYKNFQAMKESRPQGTKLTREVNWQNMKGSKQIERQPGQAFPPPEKKAGQ